MSGCSVASEVWRGVAALSCTAVCTRKQVICRSGALAKNGYFGDNNYRTIAPQERTLTQLGNGPEVALTPYTVLLKRGKSTNKWDGRMRRMNDNMLEPRMLFLLVTKKEKNIRWRVMCLAMYLMSACGDNS